MLATAITRAGDVDKAIEFAKRIDDRVSKLLAFKEIALEAAKNGNFIKAFEAVGEMEVPDQEMLDAIKYLLAKSIELAELTQNDKALSNLSVQLAALGDVDRSIQMVEEIDDTEIKQQSYNKIALELAKKGNFTKAFEVAKQIGSTDLYQKTYDAIRLLQQPLKQ